MNPECLTYHPLNTSTSKASHPFPKDKRFRQRTKFITESFYDLPHTRSKRTTTFGFGSKASLLNKSQSPPPGAYEAETSFTKEKAKITMGHGRETVSFSSFFGSVKSKEHVPSPNKYTIVAPLSKVCGRMGSRLPTELDKAIKKHTPGPAAYNPNKGCEVKDSGSYVLSNFKNHSSPRLHTVSTQCVGKDQRRLRLLSNLGPTTYDPVQKEMGRSFNSQHRNSQVRSFSKSKRQGLVEKSKIHFPSADKYKKFSDFGGHL